MDNKIFICEAPYKNMPIAQVYFNCPDLTAFVKVFYLHVKSEDHCEEIGTPCG